MSTAAQMKLTFEVSWIVEKCPIGRARTISSSLNPPVTRPIYLRRRLRTPRLLIGGLPRKRRKRRATSINFPGLR